MKTVLVTGDNGLVGSHVTSALKKKMRVIGLSRRHEKSMDYETVDFDLASAAEPPISGVDIVIHLAADTECKDEKSAFATNVAGTEKMLELAKRNNVESFVYASTGGVYGFGKKAFKETAKPKHHNIYSKTKYSAELLCKQYSRYFPVVILRYFFPYGYTDKNRLINRLVNKIRDSDVVEINTGGRPVINPIAVRDAAQATIKSIKPLSDYNIFNIGGSEKVSILEIVNLIEKELNTKAKITYNNNKAGNLLGDITKAAKLLKFEPKISLKQGIKDLAKKTSLRL